MCIRDRAVLDYTHVSRRWTMPARYYTKTFEDKGTTLRVVWIDTAPMIDKYRNENRTYPDACKQDYEKQLVWIDSVLTTAKEDWVIVAGHHPIYAETPKDESERMDLQTRLDPILRKHKVEMCIRDRYMPDTYTRSFSMQFEPVDPKDEYVDFYETPDNNTGFTVNDIRLSTKTKSSKIHCRIEGTVINHPAYSLSLIHISHHLH